MEGKTPELNGILLMSKKEIEEEQDKAFAKNMLQIMFAEHLGFNDEEEATSFDVFQEKYADVIRQLIKDHPEIRDEFGVYLKTNRVEEYNFNILREKLQPYLPLH